MEPGMNLHNNLKLPVSIAFPVIHESYIQE